MDRLKICSLNARGLGDVYKCNAIFTYFRDMKADIILLQEAHVRDQVQSKQYKVEWGGQLYASCGETNSRGVITLIHPNSEVKVEAVKGDSTGRILCCEILFKDKLFTLCNLYAPNRDEAGFFS